MANATPGQQGSVPSGGRNGLGIAALVFGLLAILTLWVGIGFLFAIVAVVTGVLGLQRARTGRATKRSAAVAGIALGVLTFAVTAALVFFGAVQSSNGCWPFKEHTGCY